MSDNVFPLMQATRAQPSNRVGLQASASPCPWTMWSHERARTAAGTGTAEGKKVVGQHETQPVGIIWKGRIKIKVTPAERETVYDDDWTRSYSILVCQQRDKKEKR